MYEVACEPPGTCEVDQRSFKAYLARWMAATTQLAPFTRDYIMPKLRASAQGAARACTGGLNSEECGLKWTTGSFDNALGVGEQMAALEIFQSNLIDTVAEPYTNRTGGTSRGDPNAGLDEPAEPDWLHIRPITAGDKAGAGILTAVILILVCSGSYWATFTG
jgi:mannan endo-1,6-alpha-mannosidase